MRYLLLLFISVTGFAQNLTEYINQKFDTHYNFDVYDVDSLVKEIGKYAVTQLERQEVAVNEDEFNLHKLSSKDSLLHIYTFSYNSHGTRGFVDNPIIQWKKSDGTYGAYELFPADKKGFFGLETSFYESHKLPAKNKNLYLLIGTQKGSGILYAGVALVVEIKNDYLILDYPAFYNQYPTLSYFDYIESGESDCIACIEFSPESNTISIVNLGTEDRVGPMRNPYDLINKIGAVEEVFYVFDGVQFVEKSSSK